MNLPIAHLYNAVAIVFRRAGVQIPHAAVLLAESPMCVPEERDLRAHAVCFQLQPRQIRLHAEQMPVREKKAHAGKLRENCLRCLRAEVAVAPDLIEIDRIKRIGKLLRVRNMVSQVEDHVRFFEHCGVIHRADAAVRIG